MKKLIIVFSTLFLFNGCSKFSEQRYKCSLKDNQQETESFSYKGSNGLFGNQNMKFCNKNGNVLYFVHSSYECSGEGIRDSLMNVEFDDVTKELKYTFHKDVYSFKHYSCLSIN